MSSVAFITGADFRAALDIFLNGGWVMVMLASVALVLYATAFSAWIYVIRGGLRMKYRHDWPSWVAEPEQAQGRVGEVIRYALHGPKLTVKTVRRRFEEMRAGVLNTIDRRLLVVNTLVAAAPLAGLLGTVMGMLAMFAGLSQGSGPSGMDRVAAGMFEALITTQTGLTIALPGLFLSLIVRQKRNSTERALSRLESLILTTQFSKTQEKRTERALAEAA